MTRSVATVGPAHTLRQAAAKMAIHSAGAAVVLDPDAAGPEIVTEHDILVSLARGQGPDQERDCRPPQFRHRVRLSLVSLELAAVVMVDRGRRHLVVCEGGDLVGVLSMRDVVRCWNQEGANCALPRLPAEVASTGPFARSKPGTQTSSPSSAEIDAAKVDEGHEVLNSVLGF
jgi:signal-transduction protein with cAMP-binding, CBS, and nucleotidyltransferase domain